MPALDPVAQMYQNSRDIKEAEEARQRAQNVESARRTEVARQERDPERIAVDLQNRHQVDHARLRSASPEAEALGGRSAAADELVAESEVLTPEEHVDIIRDEGPEYEAQVRKLLGSK